MEQRAWSREAPVKCLLYDKEKEMANHLFFNCSYNKEEWLQVTSLMGYPTSSHQRSGRGIVGGASMGFGMVEFRCGNVAFMEGEEHSVVQIEDITSSVVTTKIGSLKLTF